MSSTIQTLTSSHSLSSTLSLHRNHHTTAKPTHLPIPPSSCLSQNAAVSSAPPKITPKSKQIIEEESKFIINTYARTPVVLSHGIGCKLFDVEGREYLDLTSGIAVNALGHSDPDWARAVSDQARRLAHVSNIFYSLPMVELAKRLVTSSFADRVFFTNSGTEATEAAIKFARKFQRHTRPDVKDPPTEFIAFSNCFHGRTIGALSLTSKQNYRTPFEPLMPGVTFLQYGDEQASRELILSGKIAGVFVEPVQGEGGIYSATKEFLQSLRAACNEAGTLLIYDEVQCGLGRTGHLWAHEPYGVYPDIMTLAKPLAGGIPIGAVLVTEKVSSAINPGDHGSTFAGGPLACQAAVTVFDKIATPDFLASVSNKGRYFKELLVQKLGGNQHVKEVRGEGLIVGIELDVQASPLVNACLNSGLLILTAGKGNVVRLVPPLIISEQELEAAAEILLECMQALD
ncbi:hypothetical protein RND81_14G186800 [Saponaria officinalis]|uniref:Acetylornithine transaminase n=1 Tax=Saponaria officinalis TaxID=3572 RepID=A0AAW1GNY0_SAPOF